MMHSNTHTEANTDANICTIRIQIQIKMQLAEKFVHLCDLQAGVDPRQGGRLGQGGRLHR